MSAPSRPHWQPQGPGNRCVIAGASFGWLNCTPAAFAMGIEKSTLGAQRPTACDIRKETLDRDGGTTLRQCEPSAEKRGVRVDVYVGPAVVPPYWTAVQLQAGRGAVIQGNTRALNGTRFRSTGTSVNHAVWVNEVRGGSLGEPAEALVYDPAADGRRAGWGKAAQGPQWWPWATVKNFAADLKPWGDNDPRRLGPGKFYAALFPDTEPHVHLRFGATRTTPFPDRARVDVAALWAHTVPAYGTSTRVSPRLERGDLFVAYQRVSRAGAVWLGDHDGTRWVPAGKVRNIGGTQ